MIKQYLLIRGTEDGTRLEFFSADELDKLLTDMKDWYGFDLQFVDQIPQDLDTNYWPERQALLLKVSQVVVPKPVETVTRWSVD